MPSVHIQDAEIAYTDSGQGPAVLFVQGVGLAGRAWSPQTDDLSRDHRCIHFDNRGVGGSRGDTSALSIDQMARDALALLDTLQITRAHWVGHSLGGVIVQRMALIAPERAASLAFMCTFAGGRDLLRPSARLIWLGMCSRIGSASMRRRAFARLIMPDEYLAARGPESVMSELEQVFGRPLWQAPAIADVQLRALRTHDERERLQELAALRCIVMSGRHDPIATHAANTALATGLGAKHRIWGDASHALPIQHARTVNAALRAHFAAGQK
ncbi:MAG TPA: alpha/beta hydrolase [Polyangiales bacterium]|jgi:3-oxoadipate enol-lactonase|nr:alpha/beta hydrolase [Polyangiales bacterium]